MAIISRSTTWQTGDTLTAAALNAEFNVIQDDYNGNITNANASGTAAIAYSKLSLAGNIVNADISNSAAIAYSKLSLSGSVVNADISSSAAIAASKLANVVTDNTAQTITGVKTFNAGVKSVLTTDSDAATIQFDMDTSNYHTVTLGGNRQLSVINTDAGQRFIIRLKQDGTGSRTVTWFANVNWAGGAAPTLTTTASKADVFGFMAVTDTTFDGFIIGQNI